MPSSLRAAKSHYSAPEYSIRLIKGRYTFFVGKDFRATGLRALSFACNVATSLEGLAFATRTMNATISQLGYKDSGWTLEELQSAYKAERNKVDTYGSKSKPTPVLTIGSLFEEVLQRKKLTVSKSTFSLKWEGTYTRFLKPYLLEAISKETVAVMATKPRLNLKDKRYLLRSMKALGESLSEYKTLSEQAFSELDTLLFSKTATPNPFEKKCYTEQELESIFTFIANRQAIQKPLYTIIKLLYLTGLRPAELLGLQHSCIDYVRDEISIHQQWHRDLKETTETKTRSCRVIPLTHQILPLIKVLRNTYPPKGCNSFLCGSDKPLVEQDDLTHFWITALGQYIARHQLADVLPVLPLYSLRSAYITHALARGNNPALIARLAGHSVKTAEKHYQDKHKLAFADYIV